MLLRFVYYSVVIDHGREHEATVFQGVRMEKLERVLAAEDNARSGVSRAADDAASIRAAGLEEARTLEARIAAETAETIARQRSEIVGSAEAEAARISQDAGSRIGASLDTAAGRLDAVVARALSALRG